MFHLLLYAFAINARENFYFITQQVGCFQIPAVLLYSNSRATAENGSPLVVLFYSLLRQVDTDLSAYKFRIFIPGVNFLKDNIIHLGHHQSRRRDKRDI